MACCEPFKDIMLGKNRTEICPLRVEFMQKLQTYDKTYDIFKQIEDCDAVIVRQLSLGWLAAQEAQRRGIPWAVEVVGDAWDDDRRKQVKS